MVRIGDGCCGYQMKYDSLPPFNNIGLIVV